MKTTIEVADRQEGRLLKTALEDPEFRAMGKIVGALLPLSQGGRRRTLNFVADTLKEQEEA